MPAHRTALAAFLLSALVPPVAIAQVIDSLQVDVWPEYDRPAALVMYRIDLSSSASLDTPVAIPIPASVGEPHAVAWRDAAGSLLLADYVRRIEGERAMILARLGSREGQLEFYADIEFRDRSRTLRFQWPGGAAVGSLSFEIQQPSGASELEIVPEPSERRIGGDGLHYARVELGRQDQAATPVLEVRYDKDSDRLTRRPQAPSSAPAPASTAPPASTEEWGPVWLAAAAGMLLGAGAVLLAWSRRRARPRETQQAPDTETARASGEAAPFCHQCGTKTEPRATFCMECGTRLMRKPG